MERREDPVLDEVREARRRTSEACGHDAARLVDYYMRLQEQYPTRLLSDIPQSQRTGQDAA